MFLTIWLADHNGVRIRVKHQSSPSNDIQITFPLNSKESKRGLELLNDKRLISTVEQFQTVTETISNSNLTTYLNLLQDQYKDGNKALLNYIARIEFTTEGQDFIKTTSIGVHSSFSITLIAHNKGNGQTKILIATLQKEVTLPMASRILSFPSFLGIKSQDQKEMEEIVTRFSHEDSQKSMEALTMHIMADKIGKYVKDDVKINFIEERKTEL
jgi:hypothetical protein